jgi:hypothetical protein
MGDLIDEMGQARNKAGEALSEEARCCAPSYASYRPWSQKLGRVLAAKREGACSAAAAEACELTSKPSFQKQTRSICSVFETLRV